MLVWVLVAVLLGAGGLAVLAALTYRLWRQVRRLGHDIGAAAERLSAASAELERAAPQRHHVLD